MLAATLTTDECIDLEQSYGQRFGPFYQHWLKERSPEKVRRNLRLAAARPGLVAAAPRFVQSTPATPVSSTAVANVTAETNLWNPALETPIGVTDMEPGKRYKVVYGGIIQTTATPTYIFTPRAGQSATPASNVTLGAGPTITAGTIPASSPFFGEFTMVVRSRDAAYTAVNATGNGFNVVAAAAATVHQVSGMGGVLATTISNAAASGLIVSLTWSAASASNTCTVQWIDFYFD